VPQNDANFGIGTLAAVAIGSRVIAGGTRITRNFTLNISTALAINFLKNYQLFAGT
jgi:hypothetical protein